MGILACVNFEQTGMKIQALSVMLIKMPGFVQESHWRGGDALIYWCARLVKVGCWGSRFQQLPPIDCSGISSPAALNLRSFFCHSGFSHRQRNG